MGRNMQKVYYICKKNIYKLIPNYNPERLNES